MNSTSTSMSISNSKNNFEIINFDIYNLNKKSQELENTVFFFGNGNRDFSNRVANKFNESYKCKINKSYPTFFANGEIRINPIEENIRQKDIIIIQSMVETYINDVKYSINDLLLELCVLIDAVKRGSARSITVVMPMYPYQRQDRKENSRTPISARMITTILESLSISRVIVFDLHADQIQGFFGSTPLDNLFAEPYFIKYLKTTLSKDELNNTVLVSPDEGGLKRVVRMSKKMKLSAAFMYKERKVVNDVDKMIIMGDVKDKICVIVDDMIDTGGTACKAAGLLKDNGALKVIMCASHGIFSKDAVMKIYNSQFDKVCTTNTVIWKDRLDNLIENNIKNNELILNSNIYSKFDILDVSVLAAIAIERCLIGNSLSELLELKV